MEENQRLITSQHIDLVRNDLHGQPVEPTNYGGLRSYGESDTDHSSDVIYLTIGDKNNGSSVEDRSRDFTESCVSDPCKRTELSEKRFSLSKPYHFLQILIGWQPIVQLTPYQDTGKLKIVWKFINALYPALIVGVFILAFFLQYSSCYMVNIGFTQKQNYSDFMGHYCKSSKTNWLVVTLPLQCQQPVLGVYILPGFLNLVFYLYSFVLNRYVESEQLSAMIEKVTLQCSSRHFAGYQSQSKLVQSLARVCCLGILCMVVACGLPVLFTMSEYVMVHGINFTLLKACSMWRTVLIIVMTVGFIILYLSYTAMLINYGTQCQLMIFLLLGLSERIEDANLELPDTAISMVNDAAKLLKVVNGHTASCMSLLITILGLDVILFVVTLVKTDISSLEPLMSATYSAAILIAIIFIAVAVIQAGRLTAACHSLKNLGHEVRSRSLGYRDASQNALDSFLLYLSTLSIKAKLCQVPISSSLLWPITICSSLLVILGFELNVF